VAFVDVVGFVALVGSRPVAELVDVLNDFMAAVNRLAGARGGTVGKWLGDGALVYFLESGSMSRSEAAAGCAELCLVLGDTLEALSADWRRRGLTANLTTRSGIASGYCAIGDWGWDQRLDFTLIGNPVNLASRLEAEATESGAVICAATAALLEEDGKLADRIGPVRQLTVRGFGQCMVHELLPSANVRAIREPGISRHGKDLPQGL
jgi:class 3 adenylate cyclase